MIPVGRGRGDVLPKKSALKRWLLVGIIWLVTILIAINCTWRSRSSQYRSYAEQSLKDIVEGAVLQIDRLINNDTQTDGAFPVRQIAYLFCNVESARRVLRNIYVREDPGGLSTSPSVWMQGGDAVYALQGSDAEKAFYEELSEICQDYSAVFEQSQGLGSFEYELTGLEEALQSLMESVKSEIPGWN